ncbi:Trimeric intracellular cation channel type 1B.1, partial [Lamellibrachia satsuma]
MDSQTFIEFAKTLTRLKMYPYFDVAHYILMCWTVREDNHPQATGSQMFSRKHPLSCWVASMLMCFGGGIIGNLLVGDQVMGPFKDHQAVITATVVWYLINFAPFDIVYKFTKLLPVRLMIFCMKEIQRTNKIHHAILYGLKHLAGAYIQIVLYAIAKGLWS